ncbi:MAG: SMC-Scp complex subunit ScpB, partial [Clostridia bacterium]|nr:SMC-Scp complex subunit ScpB [Clostridia bacterium]
MATSETLANIIESIVFIAGNAISAKDIAEHLEVTEKAVLDAAKQLQDKYNAKSGINLLIFNKKLQFCSNPEYAESVASVLNPIRERELSRSMMEVAAIIAYKQPVTRLDLEQIRGVDSEYAIQNLLKLGVIEVVGRKDAIGRPVLFGTTDVFLKRFQIASLDDLPDYEQVLAEIQRPKTASYLFTKDTYDESKDPEVLAAQKAQQETIAVVANDNASDDG